MPRVLAPVAALLASAALLIAGNGVMNMLLPLRAAREGFDTLSVGLLGSMSAAGFVLGCLFAPRLVARVGHIRAFAGLVGVVAYLVLAHGLLVHPVAWWGFRALNGFCFAGLLLAVESWLNARSTNATRGAVFCVYAVVSHIAGSGGHLMVSLGDPGGWALFSVGAMLVSLAALPVAIARAEAPASLEAPRLRLGDLWRNSPVGVVGCFAAGAGGAAFWALGPAFALDATGSTPLVPVLMTVPVLAAALVQWPIGFLSDRIDRRLVIAAAAFLSALAGLLIVSAGRDDAALAGALALFGMAWIPIAALSVANANDFAPAEAAVATAAGLLLVNAAGSVAGPIAGALAVNAGGPAGLFLFISGLFAALGLFALWRRGRRDAPAPEARTSFVEAVISIETVAPIAATHASADASPSPSAPATALPA